MDISDCQIWTDNFNIELDKVHQLYGSHSSLNYIIWLRCL